MVPQFHTIPAGLGPKRTLVLTVALAQVGIREQPPGSNRGPEVDKFLPKWTRAINWMRWSRTKGPAWCCFCVWWIIRQALGAFPFGKHHGSCTKAYKAALKAGVFVPNDGTRVPYPGDAFLVGKGAEMKHIGFAYRVAADGVEFNTAEGNCGHRFRVGRRALDDGEIAGWIDMAPDEHPDGFERGLIEAPWTARSPTR